VITFHSIEDRVVKRLFAEFVKEHTGVLTTKKPIIPSEEELHTNSSSRSAKLRGIEKNQI
jgi:16S rRNA (cytosine1402-N4)-methyltransferase